MDEEEEYDDEDESPELKKKKKGLKSKKKTLFEKAMEPDSPVRKKPQNPKTPKPLFNENLF